MIGPELRITVDQRSLPQERAADPNVQRIASELLRSIDEGSLVTYINNCEKYFGSCPEITDSQIEEIDEIGNQINELVNARLKLDGKIIQTELLIYADRIHSLYIMSSKSRVM